MKFPPAPIAAFALLLALPAMATDVSMANGSVTFTVPDSWQGIMQTRGDPEAQVFQVPDPSPSADRVLSRVTVMVKQAGSEAAYQQFISAAQTKAQALPGYQSVHSVTNTSGPSDFIYTAQEAGVPVSYAEHYWHRDQEAIQLRCLRPAKSQAGAGWMEKFDAACSQLALQLGGNAATTLKGT